jgi:hypothetical protein
MNKLYYLIWRGFYIAAMVVALWANFAYSDNLPPEPNSDKTYREILVGTWEQKDIGPAATLEQTFSFLADGTFHSSAKLTKTKEVIKYQNHGTWNVEKGVIYITVLNSTRSDIPLGIKTPNKIISLTKSELTTENAEGIVTIARHVR